MSATYAFNYRAEAPLQSTEMLPAWVAMANQPQRSIEVASLFALYNPPSSGYSVSLLSFNLQPLDTSNASGVGNTGQLTGMLISSMSGGSPIAPISLDSANAALPPEVLIRWRPGTVTRGGTFRVLFTDLNTYPTLPVAYPTNFQTGGTSPQGATGSGIMLAGSNAETQAITLREGEGFLIDVMNYLLGTSKTHLHATIWLRNATSGEQFIISRDFPVEMDAPSGLLGIFNGVGSGVVLEVSRVEFLTLGTYATTVVYEAHSLESCIFASGGLAVPVMPLDSVSAPFPSSIIIAQRACVTQVGPDMRSALGRRQQTFGDWCYRRAQNFGSVTQTTATLGAFPCNSGRVRSMVAPARASNDVTQPYVLRGGEGICFLKRTGTAVYNWQLVDRFAISGLLTIEPDFGRARQAGAELRYVS